MGKNLVYRDGEHGKTFLEHLNNERSPESIEEFESSACDILLRHKTSPESVYLAHSMLMSFYSPRVKLELENQRKVASDRRFIVNVPAKITKEVLCSLMDYIYTGVLRIDEKPNFTMDLTYAVGYFEMDRLGHVCAQIQNGTLPEDFSPRPTETVDVYRFIVENVVKSEPKLPTDMTSLLTSSLNSMSISGASDGSSPLSSQVSYQGKMPVSALQEYLQKRGEPIPIYTESLGGPPFTVTVNCGGFTVSKTGASKKDAKHKAAEAMLAEITGGASTKHSSQVTNSSADLSYSSSNLSNFSTSLSTCDPSTISNPIGYLQEQMQKRGFPLPEYREVPPETQQPFSQVCTVPSFNASATGHGPKKNEAKRQAAKAMIEKLKASDFAAS